MNSSFCISIAIGVEYACPKPVEGVLLCLKNWPIKSLWYLSPNRKGATP
jgi:hypothetical protein